MNDDPLISVIVPMYNCGKYITKCLSSLVRQSYGNIEIIVVDDGSSDNGGEICREFSRTDSRIRYIRQENSGASSARNKGLNNAAGNWITFCDSDDYADSDLLQHLMDTAKKYNADIVQCGVIIEYNSKTSVKVPAPTNETVIKNFLQTEKSFLRYYGKTVYPKLFKSDLLKNIKFDPAYTIGEDMLFGVEAALKARKIAMTGEYKYHYFQRTDSVCNTVPDKKSLLSSRNALNEILRLLPQNSSASEFYFDEQLRNDFDICSKYVRFCPSGCGETVGKIRNELKSSLRYILKSNWFSLKEKIKAILIVRAWRLYSMLITGKKREELQN